MDDIELLLKKKRKILFSRMSPCLQPLLIQIQKQDHQTLILWALDCAMVPIKILQKKYPKEERPKIALQKSFEWATGLIKMPEAKKAILDCHRCAKEIKDEVDIALFHAIGQACSTVHVETHAIGLPIYELTAIVRSNPHHYTKLIEEKIKFYIEKLEYWENHKQTNNITWAKFLQIKRPNKEQLLALKKTTI